MISGIRGIDVFRDNYLEQFYTIEPDTNEYIIEISIRNYDDIFNTWDSSVYNLRDLDASLKSFLEACSRDIGLRNDIVLRFNVRFDQRDEEMEKNIIAGMRTNFNYHSYIFKQTLRRSTRKALLYTVLSIILLMLSLVAGNIQEMAMKVLSQILSIGAWIFLWETFTFIFFKNSDAYKRRREYERLFRASILFRYSSS